MPQLERRFAVEHRGARLIHLLPESTNCGVSVVAIPRFSQQSGALRQPDSCQYVASIIVSNCEAGATVLAEDLQPDTGSH